MIRFRLHALAFASACCLASVAYAGVCQDELAAAIADRGDPAVATGIDAARVLERAVRLIEPALPPLVVGAPVPVPDDHEAADTVRFLAERRLLPAGWTEGPLDRGAWERMLARFLAWYGLDPPPVDVPASDADVLADAAEALALASEAVRPAAVLATDPASEGALSFRALIWNWTVYPRLLVFRTNEEDVPAHAGVAEAVASLENCARTIRHYFTAPEPTARRLFLANNQGRMIVVAGEPADGRTWPWSVREGSELDVFAFRHPEVDDLDVYAAVFVGPSIGVVSLMRLLPSVRTNVSPIGLAAYFRSPR